MTTATEYTIEDLGGLEDGLGCEGIGIDDKGNVVGNAALPDFIRHAMLRRPDGQLIDLGTLSGPTVSSWASGINSRGSIAGGSYLEGQEDSHAFLIEPDGQVIDIGELVANAAREQFFLDRRHVPDEPSQWMEIRALAEHSHLGLFATGGVPSSANAVNDLDQVVGSAYSFTPTGDTLGCFLYSAALGVVDLKTLGGRLASGQDINNSHQIVGWSYLRPGVTRAFLHDGSSGSPLKPSDALPTLGGTDSHAWAINEPGDVVGDSETEGDANQHAFLYRNGDLRDLGTLGGTFSRATGVNDDGIIVGYSSLQTDSNNYAFVYENEQMYDLNGLIADNGDWILRRALSINSSGQITGWANVEQKFRGFLLTPR